MTVAERFIGEPLRVRQGTADPGAMASGEPGLPEAFEWRGRTLRVAAVLRRWRETGPCRHGSGERYVRKHWFEVLTSDQRILRVYFDRQSRGRGRPRWWLFSLGEDSDDPRP